MTRPGERETDPSEAHGREIWLPWWDRVGQVASELHFKDGNTLQLDSHIPREYQMPAVCQVLSLALRMQQWTEHGPKKLTILVGEDY